LTSVITLEGMKVLCRSQSGQWVKWRVGRRRMVFIGGPRGFTAFELGFDLEAWFLVILVVAWWLLKLIICLLATAVVWPFRALTGRWTVVAYELGDPTERPEIRRRVKGRKAGDALAREWAAIIERDGGLFLPTDVPAPQSMTRQPVRAGPGPATS
jgi:hypothetical protein